MKESIKITVVVDKTDKINELELELQVDTVEDMFFLYLDGKELCYGDWESNLRHVFIRALNLWGIGKEEIV